MPGATPGTLYVVHVVEAAPAGEDAHVEALCKEGDLATGGGCLWGKKPGMTVRASQPIETSADGLSQAEGWACEGIAASDEVISTWAICQESVP